MPDERVTRGPSARLGDAAIACGPTVDNKPNIIVANSVAAARASTSFRKTPAIAQFITGAYHRRITASRKAAARSWRALVSTRPVCGPDGKHYNATKKECMNGALNEHIVDLDQQVVFMAALFDNPRMRAIGVDPIIGKLLKAKATELHNAGVITDAGNKGIQTQLGLWATHHDHIHVSMQWW